MDIMSRDKILECLREGTCEVTFTKVNGEERVMECTLQFDMIPEELHPKSDGNSDSEVNTEVVKVFDLEKQGWRSFRVDSVTDFKYK